MKNKALKGFGIVLSAVVVTACNPLGKMIKNAGTVTYNLSPNPLEMKGDTVAMSVAGKYPANYFHKKAVVEVTPILKMTDGSTKELKKLTFRGEAAEGEGNVVKYANGGGFDIRDKVLYENSMETCSLELKIVGSYKGKTKDFPVIPLGTGTIVTPKLVQNDDRPLSIKDKFTKTEPVSANAEINYLINASDVRSNELTQDDIKALKTFIEEGVKSNVKFKGMNVSAYASPDGEISRNENLATDRATAASKAVTGYFKKAKVVEAETPEFFTNVGKGEDWEGFKTLMKSSSITDKDLIIRILEMYSDLDKREQEIKALAKTYLEVADQILPKLRRAQITLSGEKMSKTDDELKQLAVSKPDSLREEELLYAATLFEDLNQKLSIYQAFSKKYSSDFRGYNNAGYIYILQNKISEAKTELEKATNADPNNLQVKNNLGVVTRLMGDRNKAEELFKAAASAGNEVSYNLGIINIQKGDYAAAVSNLSGAGSFNEALANLLNGNPDMAAKIIDASNDKSSAMGYYLKAICGARKKSVDMMVTNLQTAISKDSSLKAKAQKDAEFNSYRNDEKLKAILQ